jgi:hypothetical protein
VQTIYPCIVRFLILLQQIYHSFAWRARSDDPNDHQVNSVYVCDLEVDEKLERDINRLLEYFSCPMPTLASLSKDDQYKRMRKITILGKSAENWAMRAHCNTFRDLQFMASLEKERAERLVRGFWGKRETRKEGEK